MTNWIETAKELLQRSLFPVALELNELDWKSNLSDKSERLSQHISAFANYSGGGYIVFGINDNGQTTPLSKTEMDLIVQKLGNIARNSLEQKISIESSCIDFQGNSILLVRVPEYNDKPVYLKGKGIFESYTRSAGQTVKLSRDEVKQLISTSSGLDFESQVTISDVNNDQVLTLLDCDKYFNLLKKQLPKTKQSILEVLAEDNLIQKSNENWNILNLGSILFAKDLNSFKDLKRKAVRVIIYKDNSRLLAIKEVEGNKGYALGFENLVNYVMDRLPTNEIIEHALRKEVKMYPEIAIREFLANALIHQDFSVKGTSVMVEIFQERIEITNQGVPLVDINRFIDTPPKSRNEKLASLMRRFGICEERGSGIDRAINSIEILQLPAPKFIRGDDYTKIILYAPVPLTRMNYEDKIRACYQHTCLHHVNGELVNNQSIRKRFNISKNNSSFASKIINETITKGLIKTSNPENVSKKFTSYIPYWA